MAHFLRQQCRLPIHSLCVTFTDFKDVCNNRSCKVEILQTCTFSRCYFHFYIKEFTFLLINTPCCRYWNIYVYRHLLLSGSSVCVSHHIFIFTKTTSKDSPSGITLVRGNWSSCECSTYPPTS